MTSSFRGIRAGRRDRSKGKEGRVRTSVMMAPKNAGKATTLTSASDASSRSTVLLSADQRSVPGERQDFIASDRFGDLEFGVALDFEGDCSGELFTGHGVLLRLVRVEARTASGQTLRTGW